MVNTAREDSRWPTGIVSVMGVMSFVHLLVDADGIVIVDTGFPTDGGRVRRAIERAGRTAADVRAILLTHGHIDHAGAAAELKAWCRAPVLAHRLDRAHVAGTWRYFGASRVTGVLEALARKVTRYRAVEIAREIEDGEMLPWWGGLKVVHLPGHTMGHCGYYAVKHDVLFSGDLWTRFMMRTQVSPAIFSDDMSLVPPSMRKARAIGAKWVIPGHYAVADGRELKGRFERLCDELQRKGKVI